ncbi:uncharacterized protein LOC131173906 [Hevea brasiliensis]|uniref:uncharacterized protein LOC131173906 n=1 Tax=Hevea brasiliensis TaxID=3981 RepID=UPI0025D8C6FD|nr:uncharacterized protein LOC131173906 [Hevea brasiliensis]
MVKKLKNQATVHKHSCLDSVMAELKWWMMRLIAHEDYELQLSDLGPVTGMAASEFAKESCKRKREVAQKVREMKEAAASAALTSRRDYVNPLHALCLPHPNGLLILVRQIT